MGPPIFSVELEHETWATRQVVGPTVLFGLLQKAIPDTAEDDGTGLTARINSQPPVPISAISIGIHAAMLIAENDGQIRCAVHAAKVSSDAMSPNQLRSRGMATDRTNTRKKSIDPKVNIHAPN